MNNQPTNSAPFGSGLVNRNFSVTDKYKFGFNKGSLKDNEIYGDGNSYTTEFRELDVRLGGRWWSLDPKPNAFESGYLSMIDNPLRFNDILGDIVKPRTDADQKMLDKYTKQTVLSKGLLGFGKLKERRNKNYNEEFANVIKTLDAKEEVYEIGQAATGTFSDPNQVGRFKYSGNGTFEILYSTPSDDKFGGGSGAALFEEVFHAYQFTQGKFTFSNNGGAWENKQYDATDEWEAKTFALNAGYIPYFIGKNGEQITTQLGFIKKLNKVDGINFLVSGKTELVMNSPEHGGSTTLKYQPAYPNLGTSELNSNLQERTFNSQIVGYPYAK